MKRRSELFQELLAQKEIKLIEDDDERFRAGNELLADLEEFESSSFFKNGTVEEFERWEEQKLIERVMRSVDRRQAVRRILDSEETAKEGV